MKQQLRVSWFPDALQTFGFAARRRLRHQALNELEDGGATFIKRNVNVGQLECIIHIRSQQTSSFVLTLASSSALHSPSICFVKPALF